MARRVVDSPVGPLSVTVEEDAITGLRFGALPGEDDPGSNLLDAAQGFIERYFQRNPETCPLPLRPAGTDFQHQVWDQMLAIPFGHTKTYGDIAKAIGGTARSVGWACGSNPIPLLIPCHRVMGAGGRFVGFSGGSGVPLKADLLRHEGGILL